MFLVTLLRLGGAAASIYMLLCIVRIFMTWLPDMIPGVAGDFVVKATEPYLGFSGASAFWSLAIWTSRPLQLWRCCPAFPGL
jgi:hypothetical protein